MERKWIVYKHTNKINSYSYIGITSRKPEIRWGVNGRNYRPCKGRYSCFYNAIKKYGWDNFEHEILENDLTYEQACDKERYYISFYNTKAPYGYNLTDGGEGTCGYESSENFCKKRSELVSGGNNPTASKVQYGDIIFDTIKDCAVYLGVDRNKIVRWINGQTVIPIEHYNNNLRFLEKEPNYKLHKLPPHSSGEKVQYNGKIYDSIDSCAKVIGVNSNTLGYWLSGKNGLHEDYEYLLYTDLSFVDKPTFLRKSKTNKGRRVTGRKQ